MGWLWGRSVCVFVLVGVLGRYVGRGTRDDARVRCRGVVVG
jgi:hypothetical protein